MLVVGITVNIGLNEWLKLLSNEYIPMQKEYPPPNFFGQRKYRLTFCFRIAS